MGEDGRGAGAAAPGLRALIVSLVLCALILMGAALAVWWWFLELASERGVMG